MQTELSFLIADKQPFYRSGIKSALNNLSFTGQIYEAADGLEVLKIIPHNEVKILIIDSLISFIGIDDCIKVIKQRHPAIRIICLLNRLSPGIIDTLVNHEIDGIISKACDQEILGESIEAVTKGHTFRDQDVKELILKKRIYNFHNKTNHLTPREKEVLKNITFGKLSKEIAAELIMSEETVKKHRRNILQKINGHTTTDLIRYSLKHHIVGVQEFLNSSELSTQHTPNGV